MKKIPIPLFLLGITCALLTGCSLPFFPHAAGWAEKDGKTYYYLKNGSHATGWQTIDGQRYCFTREGTPMTGWQLLGNKTYSFRPDGTPITGWVPGEQGSRYFDETGAMLTGRHEIQGRVHFFAPNGIEVPLANAQNALPEDYTVELKEIGGGRQIAAICYEDLRQMFADCKAAGCSPAVCSAYRSREKQEKLFRRKVNFYRRQGHSDADAVTLAGTVVAAPGTSEHQLGLALDIVDSNHWNLDETQESTPTQQWLMQNSWQYGFILRYPNDKSQITGVIYEPWHYRWVGREIAADLHESGLCLEEYLGAATMR